MKEVHGSGGYGMLIGPKEDKATIAAFRAKLKSDPKNFIAQPTLALSTCPTCVEEGIAPRHVDLRPFVLNGRDRIRIVPGGLTRVALKKARWWSIPAKAAAPKILGCWTDKIRVLDGYIHALAHRR